MANHEPSAVTGTARYLIREVSPNPFTFISPFRRSSGRKGSLQGSQWRAGSDLCRAHRILDSLPPPFPGRSSGLVWTANQPVCQIVVVCLQAENLLSLPVRWCFYKYMVINLTLDGLPIPSFPATESSSSLCLSFFLLSRGYSFVYGL